MKNILIFLFSTLAGFITCFAILYWLFHFELVQSLISSTGAFIGGAIGLAGYNFFLKRKINRITKSTSECTIPKFRDYEKQMPVTKFF